MKKPYKKLVIAIATLIWISASAQVSQYVFLQKQDVYTAITTGGTVFGIPTSDDDYFASGVAPTLNSVTGPGIQIGFTFTFNANVYDVIGIQNNGWIGFGQSTLTPNPINLNVSNAYTGISGTSTSPAALQNHVAGCSRDIQGNGGSLRVVTIGSAPTRTCVIQWTNYKIFGGTDIFSFQIRLCETTNIIDVVYGDWSGIASISGAEVGLRGATNADFNNRSVVSPNVWATSIPGTVVTAVCNWNTTGLRPANGQLYEWIPPVPCTTPVASDATASFTNVCGGANVNLGLNYTYTNSGISYQWQSSTTGTAGIFSNITGATGLSTSSGALANTMAYRAVITCSNGPVVINSTPVLVTVGPPSVSNAIAAIPLICPNKTGSVSLGQSYAGLGVSYQWQTSTVNIVGPYGTAPAGTNAATSGTIATYVSPTLTTTTYFQAILSCTAAPSLSTISLPVAINIQGLTTSVVSYTEDFEGIFVNDQLPNCSWSASNPTAVCQTYTTANTFNRIAASGSKYASFKSPTSPNGDYFYTNGIQMEPGITYSASVNYITDGFIGWTGLSILVGTAQTVPSLTNIVSAAASIIANAYYKTLSNTFTVGASGLYYIAIKGQGSGVNYLTFDDVIVTAPCSINSPTIAVTGPTAVCSGQTFIYSASGADSYTWMPSGVTTSTSNLSLTGNANVIVIGANAASGCTSTLSTAVTVNQSPPISINIVSTNNATYVCKGSSTSLAGNGAGAGGQYSWSSGTTGLVITVSPTVATTYTVVGTNVNGCSASAVQQIGVKTPPSVAALSSANSICSLESATLTATGANSYTWSSNNNYVLGTQVVVTPNTTTTYTVVGADAFNCQATSLIVISVSGCVGLNEINGSADLIRFYPNPTSGQFTLEFTNDNTKSIEVVDLTGRLVLSTKSTGIKTDVNISELSAGIYYVKIRDNKMSSVLKIVKQ